MWFIQYKNCQENKMRIYIYTYTWYTHLLLPSESRLRQVIPRPAADFHGFPRGFCSKHVFADSLYDSSEHSSRPLYNFEHGVRDYSLLRSSIGPESFAFHKRFPIGRVRTLRIAGGARVRATRNVICTLWFLITILRKLRKKKRRAFKKKKKIITFQSFWNA